MKAIETRYNGHRFRSRTEARWAVFFDHLGVPYEYEHEGYELDDGTRYLPDFYLPREDCFFEIKGAPATDEDLHKAGLLAFGSRRIVNVISGQPGYEEIREIRPQEPLPPELQRALNEANSFSPTVRDHLGVALHRLGYAAKGFDFHAARLASDVRYRVSHPLSLKIVLDIDEEHNRLAMWKGHPEDFEDEAQPNDFGLLLVNVRQRPSFYRQTLGVGDRDGDLRVYRKEDIGAGEGWIHAPVLSGSAKAAYQAARSARFEFGESGAG